jgi:hypothetical protein
MCLRQSLSGNGFQRRRYLKFRVHVLNWPTTVSQLTKLKVRVKTTLRLKVNQLVLVSSPVWGWWPDIYCSLTVTALFLWGALSDERTGLYFEYAAHPRQQSLSRVRVSCDSWPYFTVSDLRLPFSSSPMTRRVTVEIFDPASSRVT